MRERDVPEDEGEVIDGRVIRIDSGASQVDTPAGVLRCVMRGRLAGTKAEKASRWSGGGDVAPGKHLLAVGDEVRVRPLHPGEGVIEEVLPRLTKLSRRAAGGRLEQVVAANIDQIVIVSSLLEPPLNLNLVDRYLVAADGGGFSPILCINKVDLGGTDLRETVAAELRAYEALGYPAVWTSASTGAGIDDLRALLAGHTSVLAGKSGVGKSALLNAVEPGLHLASEPISAATGKGRHTTTFTSLLPLSAGGYVIDTPGVRQYTLWEVDPAALGRRFPEIAALENGCRFANCSHSHEPECAVKAGVAAGQVEARRHASYLRILGGLDEE